jgi:hypothetical protein
MKKLLLLLTIAHTATITHIFSDQNHVSLHAINNQELQENAINSALLVHFLRQTKAEKQETCEFFEKFLKNYNHTLENTDSSSYQITAPVKVKVEINGEIVDSIEEISVKIPLDLLLKGCKRFTKNNID